MNIKNKSPLPWAALFVAASAAVVVDDAAVFAASAVDLPVVTLFALHLLHHKWLCYAMMIELVVVPQPQ